MDHLQSVDLERFYCMYLLGVSLSPSRYYILLQEFIHQYKILLPKGLVSSKDDVRDFLEHLDLNTENFQIGKTKVSPG